jgi:hypothetical protein
LGGSAGGRDGGGRSGGRRARACAGGDCRWRAEIAGGVEEAAAGEHVRARAEFASGEGGAAAGSGEHDSIRERCAGEAAASGGV